MRFEDQRVTLNAGEAPAQAGFSDILLGASVNVNDHWGLESTVQYNGKTEQSERAIGRSFGTVVRRAGGIIAGQLREQVMGQLRRRGAVVGLSGGIDSSVVAALCVLVLPSDSFVPDLVVLGLLVGPGGVSLFV